MQVAQATVTNGFRNAGIHISQPVPSPSVPPAEEDVSKENQQAQASSGEIVPEGCLPNLLGRIYDFIEKKDCEVSRREVMDALDKEGYHPGTVNAAFNTLKSLKIVEVYTGGGTRGDPDMYWFCDGAVRPTGKPYRHIRRLTREQKKEQEYLFAKAAAEKYTQTQKRMINATPKQIPAGTNSSLASEMQRLHIGETLSQPGSGEARQLPSAIGTATTVAVESGVVAAVHVASSMVPEALKNTEFKLSWRGQQISFEEAFKMKLELELITQMISSFSPK